MSDVLALARPELLQLKSYVHATWDPTLVRLHANESPWRPDGDHSLTGLNRYPEPQSSQLIVRLAQLYGVRPEQVMVGRGSDEGIDLLVRAFCAAGRDRVLVCPPTFAMYRFAAELQGAAVTEVPLSYARDFALDPEALLAAWTPSTKLVFLCSPNNPTGNLMDRDAVETIVRELSGRAVVVVDEAYVELAKAGSLAPWLDRFPNLAILRTLSKAYGLAGVRCGAVLGAPEVIGLLRCMIPPYAVTVPTIEAALAALEPASQPAIHERIGRLVEERELLSQALERVPRVRRVWPSDTNFLLVQCDDAGRMLQAGIEGGLLVRDVRKQLGLQDCLRITVGTARENARLIAALEAA